jgi:opacity protein-like surface antigen
LETEAATDSARNLAKEGDATMKQRLSRWGMLLVLATGAISAQAQTAWDIEVSGGQTRWDIRERTQSGGVLNQDIGMLSTAGMALGYRQGPIAVHASFSRASNTIPYRGFTQFGLPLQTRTDMTRELFEVDARWQMALGGDVEHGFSIAPKLGLRADHRRRNILATPQTLPLSERWRENSWGAGAGARWNAGPWAFGAEATRWQASSISVAALDLIPVPATVFPRTSSSSEVSVHAELALSNHWRLRMALKEERFRTSASPDVTVTAAAGTVIARYPGSDGRASTWALALSHQW